LNSDQREIALHRRAQGRGHHKSIPFFCSRRRRRNSKALEKLLWEQHGRKGKPTTVVQTNLEDKNSEPGKEGEDGVQKEAVQTNRRNV
jgi:hypothetical protein